MRATEFIFESPDELDLELRHRKTPSGLIISADHDGYLVGQVSFNIRGDTLVAGKVTVHPDFRRKGVATQMYNYAKSLGYSITPSASRTDDGLSFWQNKEVWEDSGSRDTNFKQWFGNSKVVDATGKPLVVYHGTDKDFSKFESASGVYYFTPDAEYAGTGSHSAHGDRQLMPVFLSIQNPAVIDSREQLTDKTVNKLRRQGYDGAIGKINHYVFEYIAFHPTQIKSAIGNRGNYDSTNADITTEAM